MEAAASLSSQRGGGKESCEIEPPRGYSRGEEREISTVKIFSFEKSGPCAVRLCSSLKAVFGGGCDFKVGKKKNVPSIDQSSSSSRKSE